MIIDAHTHIGLDKDGTKQSIVELKTRMSECGITSSVVFPFDTKGDLIAASLDLLKHKSESIIPFLRFDPKSTRPEDVRLLLGRGFAGVKLHPRSQNFDPLDKRYNGIFAEIESSGKPLLVHTRKESTPYSDPDRVVLLADDFPQLNIIIGHFAYASTTAMDYIKTHRNLFLETSIMSNSRLIGEAVDRLGHTKIIFGSDAPMSDQGAELQKVKEANLDKSTEEGILWKNLSSLL